MTKIEWTTPKGSDIQVVIETNEANLADERATSTCYKLVVYANGQDVFAGAGFDVVDHEQVGPALKGWFGDTIVPIDSSMVAAVKDLIADYHAEVSRRMDNSVKAEAAYQDRYNAIEQLRTTGRI